MKQNLTLLNQARSRDLTTLAATNAMFGDATPVDTSDYESTDDRELRAAFEALKDNHEPLGEPLYDEDLEIFRSSL